MPNTTERRKKRVLESLRKSLGVVTTACKAADVGRTQFYQWMKDDPEFREAVKDTEEIALDFVESKLYKAIESGNVAAIIFALKTKGKKRGYVEGTELKVYTPDNAPSWLDGSPIADEAAEDVP